MRSFSHAVSGPVSEDVRNSTNTYDFTYTNNGRLASASLNGTQVGTYIDNGLGQRVAKTAYGVTNHYLFDRFGHLLAENDGMGTPIREYIWLDDLPVAMIDHTGASPVTYYIHTDQLGRPQKMTDASANLVWDAIFQPFGEVYAVSGSASNFLMFPGQFYDGETQLSQNWHRDYDPTIGRYIQSDPIGLAGGINTYAYVGGNPMRFLDPRGLLGFGVTMTGSGDAGIYIGGLGATGFAGAGIFLGGPNYASLGEFAGIGGFAGGPRWGLSYPICPDTNNWAMGAFGGGGVNLFLTNGENVRDVSGPFKTFSFNAGWRFRLIALQIAVGQNASGDTIWMASVGLPAIGNVPTGVGYGASVSSYNTNTWTTNGGGQCQCH